MPPQALHPGFFTMLSLRQSRSSSSGPFQPMPGQRVQVLFSNPLTSLSPGKGQDTRLALTQTRCQLGASSSPALPRKAPGTIPCPASLPSCPRVPTRSSWHFRCSFGSWTLVGLSRSKGWCRMSQLRLASTSDTFHLKWVGTMTTKLMLFLKGK
uniref:Uncharacterized protein n=2 Tax=Equus TaxID=9789 RepID=A0A9L0SF79_HORSE